MYLIKLAFRNLWRKKKESFLIGLAVFVSSWVILLQIAQRNHVEKRAESILIESISGQFMIYRTNELSMNILESQLDEMPLFFWDEKNSKILKSKLAIEFLHPRLRFNGLIAFDEKSIGLNLQALTCKPLSRLSSSLEFIYGGVDTIDSKKIIVHIYKVLG